jgi:hypothetical protein
MGKYEEKLVIFSPFKNKKELLFAMNWFFEREGGGKSFQGVTFKFGGRRWMG